MKQKITSLVQPQKQIFFQIIFLIKFLFVSRNFLAFATTPGSFWRCFTFSFGACDLYCIIKPLNLSFFSSRLRFLKAGYSHFRPTECSAGSAKYPACRTITSFASHTLQTLSRNNNILDAYVVTWSERDASCHLICIPSDGPCGQAVAP